MKIKILWPPPNVGRGLKKGKIYNAELETPTSKCVNIKDDTGKTITLLPNEFAFVNNND